MCLGMGTNVFRCVCACVCNNVLLDHVVHKILVYNKHCVLNSGQEMVYMYTQFVFTHL